MIERDYAFIPARLQELFWPDYLAATVQSIDFGALERRGIRAIMIDLDDTVVARGKFEVDAAVTAALRNQPLKVYIATNRPRSRSLKNLCEALHAQGVTHPSSVFGKPSKRYYQSALKAVGLPPHQVVMVGDRLLQDTFGARRAGIVTISVTKLGEPRNLVDQCLSFIEARFKTRIAKLHYRPVK